MRARGLPPATVHPRSRGEHELPRGSVGNLAGSSPLARGTRRVSVAWHVCLRFIPARAGNTTATGPSTCSPTVHPRSRGEHEARTLGEARVTGSSPLARGTRTSCPTPRSRTGFIPARAGNTLGVPRADGHQPVHPRSRGEHRLRGVLDSLLPGSSPLARGTPRRDRARLGPARFIPARAGNTSHVPAREPHPPVHPRSRGEHFEKSCRAGDMGGSSPLARGTRLRPRRLSDLQRFIPARAGNTRRSRSRPRSRTVHPRSRGEHSRELASGDLTNGSSPLARGTRRLRGPGAHLIRFIPARAGNTAEEGV